MKKRTKLKAQDGITIERTNGGVPLIKAQNQNDMYFGIGYCHAYDRGTQMTMMKILGQGRASEILSGDDEMLEIDKFFRRMNWHNNLKEEINKLNQLEISYLESYCNGVNEAFKKRTPWELKFLVGYKKFSWSIEDIILLARMAGYLTLAQSQGEIERFFIQMVQKGVDYERLCELFPDMLDDYDEDIIKQITIHEKIIPDAVKWNVATSSFMASNNWVIGGNKTISGLPILANDPHLEINRLPSVWYELAIKTEAKYAYSATMPGIPSLLIGRNNYISWGATYSFMDAIDSWIEKCENGQYLKEGSWHPFHVRKELIKRKKADAVEIDYYENEHGVLDGTPNANGYYLATKWSGERCGAQSIKASFDMWQAQSVEEGMQALEKLEASFCWVLSDVEGNIGMQMSGLMPKRKEGWLGFVPKEGWKAKNDWQGFHDPKDLPRIFNPEEGYIITTNNKLNHLGKESPINICMGEYRADRIRQMIISKDKHTIEDSKKIQYDTHSLQAELFIPKILNHLPEGKNAQILKNWDLCYDIDSKGAYIFEMIYRSLYSEVFGSVLGKELNDFLQNETGIFIDFYVNFDEILLANNSTWFNGRTADQIYKSAIENVINLPAQTWGEFNQITLTNMLLGGKLPKMFGYDKGPYALPGSRATVHQGQIYRSAGRNTSFAPSYRMITDMANDVVYSNLSGGVSDRRFSRLYNNDFDNARRGIYKEIHF